MIMSEEDFLQKQCIQWFKLKYPKLKDLIFHVPNGGYRSPREGRKFKLMGVLPGVPDLIFLYHSRIFCFELKTKKGTLTKSQKHLHPIWNDHLAENVYIVRSLDEFIKSIEAIVID